MRASAITYYMSEFRRNVLELIIRKNGTLGAPRAVPKEERTTFSLLHILKQNNSCLSVTLRLGRHMFLVRS